MILGGLVGYWLDLRLNTSPTWTLILVLLGTVAGFVRADCMVNKMNE